MRHCVDMAKKSVNKDEIKIHCKYDKLVDPSKLNPHPKNRNSHSPEQIERLAKIIKYQGWRYPVKVSNRSGCITTGHGRAEAAKVLKCKVPVVYQDYESEEQEYADVQSDNAIALWAKLDLSGINTDLEFLGPDFEIDLLGIKSFSLDPDFSPGTEDDQGKLDEIKIKILECPYCEKHFEQTQAKIIS